MHSILYILEMIEAAMACNSVKNHHRKKEAGGMGAQPPSLNKQSIKDKDYCPIEIIKGLTDKGQFQYLTKFMGPQEGTYLYATQFHSLR